MKPSQWLVGSLEGFHGKAGTRRVTFAITEDLLQLRAKQARQKHVILPGC